jgi:hypothetical protein
MSQNRMIELKAKQTGGDQNDNVPTGCCPPITYCDVNKIEQIKNEKDRNKGLGTAPHKSSLSIKDIMGERRVEKKPFMIL